MTVTLFGQMVCGMLCQPSAKISDPILSARSYQDIAGLQILAVTLRSLESSDGGFTPSLMVKFMGKYVYHRLSIGWFTWFFTKGVPQFMKNPWLLLRVGPCGSPLHIANTGALSASGTTPRKWQVTKSWITTHLWTIHGKWLITWVKDMTH